MKYRFDVYETVLNIPESILALIQVVRARLIVQCYNLKCSTLHGVAHRLG